MIRIATMQDITKVSEFAEYYKEKKNLFPDSEFKITDFKSFILDCLRMKNTKVFVSDHDGEIKGFLIMSVDHMPWNKSKKWASDVLFAAEKDASALLRTAIQWAKALNCHKIFLSNSTGHYQADKFFELMGLKRVGGQYEYPLL